MSLGVVRLELNSFLKIGILVFGLGRILITVSEDFLVSVLIYFDLFKYFDV